MRLFSAPPSPSSSHLPRLFSSPNPNPSTVAISVRFFHPRLLLRCSAAAFRNSSSVLVRSGDVSVEASTSEKEDDDEVEDSNLLVVRRPVKDGTEDEEATIGSLAESNGRRKVWKREKGAEDGSYPITSSKIDRGLSEFAKSMPMFEPARVEEGGGEGGGVGAGDRPLPINLELGLYRAKVLTRNFKFKEAEEVLRKCISFWPEDGRPYVALGKLLSKQSKFVEARSVYERGCQATQGENSYIWQCWAVLENKVGNIKRARELFDAATVADKRHVAAWHGWAVLEIKQGNIKKARNLLAKGLRYCGGNEYIYQTLALLEAKGQRIQRARYLFQQATKCNPKSCASWLAWAQVEMQQQNNYIARQLFEKAVQASPKNRFAWHIWALFEANQGNIDKGRKLFKIGHALNPKDPVILQSLALLEYRQSSPSLARAIFKKASVIDPRHQPVWIAWGWMEWKEGNINAARELYQRAISIDSTSDSAARCLQAWGVLEQRVGNLSVARRLFRSSLNINSQSYITWMTWASLEDDQGNAARAEEIRNLYYQQRTEVVDDASWVMGLSEIIDPALDGIKRLLNLDQGSNLQGEEMVKRLEEANDHTIEASSSLSLVDGDLKSVGGNASSQIAEFDLDGFVRDKLKLDVSKLDVMMVSSELKKLGTPQRPRRVGRKVVLFQP